METCDEVSALKVMGVKRHSQSKPSHARKSGVVPKRTPHRYINGLHTIHGHHTSSPNHRAPRSRVPTT